MEEYKFPFEHLDVWKTSVDLADFVLSFSEQLPTKTHTEFIKRMEDAVVSSAQTIAKGKACRHTEDFLKYLYAARSSTFEVATLNEILGKKSVLTEYEKSQVRLQCEQLVRKLDDLIDCLQTQKRDRSSREGRKMTSRTLKVSESEFMNELLRSAMVQGN
jgi:four helix bundle protein